VDPHLWGTMQVLGKKTCPLRPRKTQSGGKGIPGGKECFGKKRNVDVEGSIKEWPESDVGRKKKQILNFFQPMGITACYGERGTEKTVKGKGSH